MKQFMAGCLFFVEFFFHVLGGIACRDHSESRAFDKLSNDIFNEKVLEFHDIPWLEKPENITKKSAKKERSNNQHIFEGYIQDEQSFWEYGEYIYDTFVERDYTLGVFVDSVVSGNSFATEGWTLIKKPTSFEDCYEIKNTVRQDGNITLAKVEIYYSVKGVDKEYSSKKGGYEMLKPRRIDISLIEEQDGSLVMLIWCLNKCGDVFFVEI